MKTLKYTTTLRSAGYANESIEPVVTVDKLDVHDELRYAAYDCGQGRTAYVAFHESGYASFMVHVTDNESGYCGREFTLNMVDGATRKIRGPWSSNARAINEVLASYGESRQVIEALISEGKTDDRGFEYLMSGAWDKERLATALGDEWLKVGYTREIMKNR